MEAYLPLRLMNSTELGRLFQRRFFSHPKIDEALRPKPRRIKPNRVFNYALHGVYEWAKAHKKEVNEPSSLYSGICELSDEYDLYYPAEVACFVAGELFGEKVPLAEASEDQERQKPCRDFIRKHESPFEEDELPLLIFHGKNLVRRLIRKAQCKRTTKA